MLTTSLPGKTGLGPHIHLANVLNQGMFCFIVIIVIIVVIVTGTAVHWRHELGSCGRPLRHCASRRGDPVQNQVCGQAKTADWSVAEIDGGEQTRTSAARDLDSMDMYAKC